jgi:CRISPR-associated protein (TIGR02710 family)
VADPDDVSRLFEEFCGWMDEVRSREAEVDLWVDFTSGTKPMSAALLAAGVSRGATQMCYVTGPRDLTGRVTESTDVQQINPVRILADQQMKEAVALFNAGNFPAASRISDRLRRLESGQIAVWAKTLFCLGRAYEAWDLFNWKEAANLLGRLLNSASGCQPQEVERLQRQLEFVQSCARGTADTFSLHRMVDLIGNARRRLAQARYDDAVARCYRAFEYLAQLRMIEQHGCSPGQLKEYPVSSLSSDMSSEFGRQPTISLGLVNCYRVLIGKGDELGQRFDRDYRGSGSWQKPKGTLAALLNKRNSSYLAHGTLPVAEPTADQIVRMAAEYVEAFVPDAAMLLAATEMIRWEAENRAPADGSRRANGPTPGE